MGVSQRLRKSLGQHWLTDRRYLQRVAEAVGATGAETVIEVGAGTGLLTEHLAEHAARVIALEIDSKLVTQLRARLRGRNNVWVVEGDALTLRPEDVLKTGGGGLPYIVAGNLPYFIGTAIVRRYLRDRLRPGRLVVTLQAEVAESVAATPPRMSYLALETQLFAAARVLFRIPGRAFSPAPKVDSAVVRLVVRDSPDVDVDNIDRFLGLVHAGFAAPRKRLRNSLAIGLRIEPPEAEVIIVRAGLDASQRPAELSLEGWRALYFSYRALKAGIA